MEIILSFRFLVSFVHRFFSWMSTFAVLLPCREDPLRSLCQLTFISRRWSANEYLFSQVLKEMNDQFTLKTSSAFMLFETLTISSPLGKEILSVSAARLRLSSFVDSSPDVSTESHRSSIHFENHPLIINNLSFASIDRFDRTPLLNSSEHRSMNTHISLTSNCELRHVSISIRKVKNRNPTDSKSKPQAIIFQVNVSSQIFNSDAILQLCR